MSQFGFCNLSTRFYCLSVHFNTPVHLLVLNETKILPVAGTLQN